jgi:hypothetical protein
MAHGILQAVTGEAPPDPPADGKDPLAVELGRRGGLKGGPARAKKLSKEQLSKIGKAAAEARWKKHKKATGK